MDIYQRAQRRGLTITVCENHELTSRVAQFLRGEDPPLPDRRMPSAWIRKATPGID